MTLRRRYATVEENAAAKRLSDHLTRCAVEYFSDGALFEWTTPDGEKFELDTDSEYWVMVGPDGRRYGVDVDVTAWPLPAQTTVATTPGGEL